MSRAASRGYAAFPVEDATLPPDASDGNRSTSPAE